MMVLLFYFLIAAVAVVAASAIIGLLLTNFIIGRFKTYDRVSQGINLVPCGAKMERHANHCSWRFEYFSRRNAQTRLASVLIRHR